MKELKELKKKKNVLKANLGKIKNPDERKMVEKSLADLDKLIDRVESLANRI